LLLSAALVYGFNPVNSEELAMRTIAGLLYAAAFVVPAHGAIYHVAMDGVDSAAGGPQAPFRTLSRAVRAAGPGDTVVVHDGMYGPEGAMTGGDYADYSASPVVLRTAGRAGEWITIKAEHKWAAVLDCQLTCDSYIDLKDASYVVIQDFVITRGYKEAIHSNDSAHHVVLRGNRIEFIANRSTNTRYGLDGLYAGPNCHDFVIDGNVFHDIGRTDEQYLDHALYLRGWNHVVRNNVFYNITRGWAIQLADGASNILIANNTFAFPNPGKDGHIMLWNTQSGLTIRNNIFYQPRGYAITRYASAISGFCAVESNLVYGVSRLMSSSNDCALGRNQTNADPLFVNASKWPYDFRLRPGSPAIAAGIFDPLVLDDFDGQPRGYSIDLGAFRAPAPPAPDSTQ
jgi:hypothetical protein